MGHRVRPELLKRANALRLDSALRDTELRIAEIEQWSAETTLADVLDVGALFDEGEVTDILLVLDFAGTVG